MTEKYATNVNDIKWIDILLETPISDYRKNAISLILARYLINIKKLPYTNAFDIIKDWLNKCDPLRRLDPNFNSRVKSALEDAIQKGIPPMSLIKLREKNRSTLTQLYTNVLLWSNVCAVGSTLPDSAIVNQ
jgi:Primase X